MARWFDNAARSAARRGQAAAVHPSEGLTRRTVLTRGAVVAGVAWTAPLLMQTRAYAGASMCGTGTFACPGTGTNTSVICCTTLTQTCQTDLAGVPSCPGINDPGGKCGNQGVGECTSSTGIRSNCNGNLKECNNCSKTYICGGEGAPCNTTDICGPGTVCAPALGSTLTYCRKVCVTSGDCTGGQLCDSTNYCAEPCKVDSDCIGKETCVSDGKRTQKICNYDQR